MHNTSVVSELARTAQNKVVCECILLCAMYCTYNIHNIQFEICKQ